MGTATKIGKDLWVTAAHVISANGRFLACSIDSTPLQLVFSVPHLDFALVKGMPRRRECFKGSLQQSKILIRLTFACSVCLQ